METLNFINEWLKINSIDNEEWVYVNYIDVSSGELIVDPEIYVSNKGRFVSFRTSKPRLMNPQLNNCNYLILKIAGKYRTCHRIVAGMWLPITESQIAKRETEINHIDGNSLNNDVTNLEWVDRKTNCRKRMFTRKYLTGLYTNLKGHTNNKPIIQFSLTGEYIAEYSSLREIHVKLGFNTQRISNVCKGKWFSANGYKWLFKSDYEELNNQAIGTI